MSRNLGPFTSGRIAAALRRASVAGAALSILVVATPAAAQTLTVVDQERSVFGFVIVPQCGGDDTEMESAPDFGPFNALASAALSCETASALASAGQRSVLGADVLRARGRTVSQAAATAGNVIHAIASSFFEVDFSIAAPASFVLRGELTSGSSAAAILGGALVKLTGPQGETLVDEQVVPGRNGEPTVLTLDETLQLEAGTYTLRATADTVIDNEVPPNRFATSSYRVTFGTAPPN